MPRTAAAKAPSEVAVRQLAPEIVEETDEQEVLLHRPVNQLQEFPPGFKTEYVWFTPEMARAWVKEANQSTELRQRPISMSQIRRWQNLYKTDRFVHFLPAAPLCETPNKVSLNGLHRLTALAGMPDDIKAGFVVFRKVPSWMFSFFDTNKSRTIRDVFAIGNRLSGPHTGPAMKLALRYEEFLLGRRKATGWRHWNLVKDEHQDIDEFYGRRDELQDWYGVGEKLYKTARINAPAAMVFRYYQQLAWPDGDDEIADFLEKVHGGAGRQIPQHPGSVLRHWSVESYTEHQQVFAKRETHLMLLFRCFAQAQAGTRIPKIVYGYGQPMSMPYHPKGHEVALKNTRSALDEIDREGTVNA